MNNQEIRAAAAQATASLMCTVLPRPADFVAMAEVIEAYIRDGKEAAFALCPAFVDSTPVFADGVHMTAEYSERIGGSVARGATGELTAGPSP